MLKPASGINEDAGSEVRHFSFRQVKRQSVIFFDTAFFMLIKESLDNLIL